MSRYFYQAKKQKRFRPEVGIVFLFSSPLPWGGGRLELKSGKDPCSYKGVNIEQCTQTVTVNLFSIGRVDVTQTRNRYKRLSAHFVFDVW